MVLNEEKKYKFELFNLCKFFAFTGLLDQSLSEKLLCFYFQIEIRDGKYSRTNPRS